MTTAPSTMGIQQTGRIAFVTESEERMLATLRGMFDFENEDKRKRAWAAFGRKETALDATTIQPQRRHPHVARQPQRRNCQRPGAPSLSRALQGADHP